MKKNKLLIAATTIVGLLLAVSISLSYAYLYGRIQTVNAETTVVTSGYLGLEIKDTNVVDIDKVFPGTEYKNYDENF